MKKPLTSFAPESFQMAKASEPVPRKANKVPHPRARNARLAPVSEAISIDPVMPLLKKLGSVFLAVANVLPKPTAAEMPENIFDVKVF